MAEEVSDARVSFPYMTAAQWFGIRTKLRQSVPKAIDVDWIMAALGTSEKGAKNILPQLRAVGLIDPDGSPSDLALDLRDDDAYATASARVLEALYPESLRSAYNDPDVESSRVSSWFMRNAKTGQVTANMQAKLYLTLLKGQLPPAEDMKPAATSRRRTDGTTPATVRPARTKAPDPGSSPSQAQPPATAEPSAPPQLGRDASRPTIHIDLQIHVSADAGREQIEAMFESMAKHLYGR